MPLQMIRQDITKMRVDAIVNPTNEEMIGYSGVDFAVHKGAGAELDAVCATLTPLVAGCPKLTRGFALDTKYIIHTVGPIWQDGQSGEYDLLKACYWDALQLAVAHRFDSIAFPLISSGAYGFPKDKVLKFAIRVITEFLLSHEMTVYLCVYDRDSYVFGKKLFAEIREFIHDEYVAAQMDEELALFRTDQAMPMDREMQMPRRTVVREAAPDKNQIADLAEGNLREYVASMDQPFAVKLFDWIDRRGMTDVECYKKANVDKKTFSKIKCNSKTYKPSKQTAVAFAIALRLNLEQTQELLACAGLTLSRSLTFDRIIRYFIQKEIYDIFEINEALFEFDQILLGC